MARLTDAGVTAPPYIAGDAPALCHWLPATLRCCAGTGPGCRGSAMQLLIATGHPLVRDALAGTVRMLAPAARLRQVQDVAGLLAGLAERPDLLLLDSLLPGLGGADGVRSLRLAHPAQRMVVAPGAQDPQAIQSVLALGVAGLLRPAESADGLTPRQLQVLRLLMQGHPNKLIARALGLSEGTVKIHVAAILRTLQVRNRTEAAMAARRLGIGG